MNERARRGPRRGEFDVIVVGAGAAGGALTLALARDGFKVALVEVREPTAWRSEDEVDLRVVALAPDARALLDDLGAWPAITQARVSPFQRMCVWDAQAPGELRFDATERGEAALGWIIENKLIQHALWTALVTPSAAGTAPVLHCPAEISALEEDADGISVVLGDGTRLRARVLVSAEGGESSLRQRLGITFDGRDYGARAVVAHVRSECAHEGTAWQRFLPTGPLAFLPLVDGRCSIVWSLPEAEAARVLALDDDAVFCAELGAAFDFRLGPITSVSRRAAFPLRLRLAEQFVRGRCVLVGDAAHLVHPLAGQGMNLGLRDVSCLRRVLGDARDRGSDLGAWHVLRHFERERRSQTTLAARGFDAIERVFGSSSPPLVALRGLALTSAGHLSPLRSLLADVAAGRL
ncbi:MAG: UbiH/UbiF/VisC/COQ6 family ubiquinone biosynthesis hydroxylase [Dokdonella sp.]|uniref:UbiH/UbiF/VisC/COQ6 family ubiquinone biosynthesis hydroxylase n=1 Tax=Dokdonella sp. TaxID=2291710 RepID=UPI0025BFAA85|nr:UbiH/UbiF/VisC/COQ6 family ubiquinone biosynthesis hydroxylase [Dokdonella sp.]MBZ0223144.1 UbiH/UbiF/VisC/COQ6 family ubiquinone biosynthesis hydroxylase [Dokdonella sp.]